MKHQQLVHQYRQDSEYKKEWVLHSNGFGNNLIKKKKTLKCSETIFHMGVHVPNPTQKEYSNHQGSVGIYKANILLTS